MLSLTHLLQRFDPGDPQASEQLLELVYDELRRLAASKLSHEKPGQTLQATALVHEVWLRLTGSAEQESVWKSRRHFFGAAAETIRRILVENARRKSRLKHGGEFQRQELNDLELAAPEPREDLLALDEALGRLAATDRAAAELVQLRYFAGMTLPDAAELLGISPRSADRLWAYARAWLHRELHGED